MRLRWFGDYRGIDHDVPVPGVIDLAYVAGPTGTRADDEVIYADGEYPDGRRVYPRMSADIVLLAEAGRRIELAFSDHRWAAYPFYRQSLGQTHDITCSRFYKRILVRRKQQVDR